ncbi:MAG TPA: HWE histidine kinase domain-containing protein [Rhizomicrobium sp.]|nr:HWE histidine kinase domain-containing protein [Rhizomicrobium sp.]
MRVLVDWDSSLSIGVRVRNSFQIWLRGLFSSGVLGTTSDAPQDLDGGIRFGPRLAAAAIVLAIAWLLAGSIGPIGVLFLFPALILTGAFGVWIGIGSLAICLAGVGFIFPVIDIWTFGTAAFVQVCLGLFARSLFRESRRWGVRYRRLIATLSEAIIVSDGDGRIEGQQPDLSKLIGMPWPDYAGQRWLEAVHPDDRKLLLPADRHFTGEMARAEIRLRDPSDGTWRWHVMRAVPLLDEDGKVEEWVSLLSDIHERRMTDDQRDMMIGEARHRLKNLITVIDSMANSSRPRPPDPAVNAFLKKFLGRLHALSAAGDLALAGNYTVLDMNSLAAATLAPFGEIGSSRIKFAGPKLTLSEGTGGALALGIHELVTNAIKYGALSVPDGTVTFTWEIEEASDDDNRVVMDWVERGGPVPKPPERDGFGARVIKFSASRERGGKVETHYDPEGFACRISFLRSRVAIAAA